ncbi:MAG TPA: glycosyltransferase family A protein [Candidatus Eisenbacteria bacterium]|nr:glycosyltransferase family A protein [Candidatus Eisenbacteria bacterium]
MTSHTSLVTFGLPVYNGENFVAEAIQCVLDQTVSNWELVICDNCSTDHTLEICRGFAERDSRIRIHQSARNMGACFNFDRAFRLSRGRFFKWITHDDLFAAQFVERCLRELERDDRVVLAIPRFCFVDANRRVLRRQSRELSVMGPTIESRAEQFMALAAGGMDFIWLAYGLIRRDVLEHVGSMGWYAASDQVLLFKLALRGCIKQVNEEMFFRREHPGAETCRRGATVRERARGAYADDNRRLVLPWCRNLKEHLVAVLDSPMPLRGKLRSITAVFKRFLTMWKFFVEEAIHSPMDALR